MVGLMLVVGLVPVRASASFSQGFEVDTSGWFDGDGTTNRVVDPYVSPVPYANGITSAAGTHHGRLRRATCDTEATGGGPAVFCTGAFTRWGGYNKVWMGGYTTQVDVYFDVAYAIANPDSPSGNIACLTADPSDTTCKGTRFDFSSAINDSTGGFLRDFVFNVGTGPDGPPTCPGGLGFVMTASNNAFRSGANPYNPARDPFCVNVSGWYTLRHTFKDVGGFLVVDMDLMQGNTIVHHWSIAPGDAIPDVGCNRYGWFANEEIWDLAIDNSQMTGCGVEVTPCSLDGWEIANFDHTLNADIGDATTASGTDGDFVSGPGTPPLGSGSFQEVVGTSGDPSSGDDATRIRTSNCNGTLLSDVASRPVSYWTYVTSFGSGGQATYIQLRIDLDNDGTTDDILFFEPVYQNGTYSTLPYSGSVPNQCDGNPGCVLLGTWQFWDARVGGWWSNMDSAGGPPLTTLAGYATQYPGAKLATDTPSLRLTAGFGGAAWAGFKGATDDLTACGTTYDFELDTCPTTSTSTTSTSTSTSTSSSTSSSTSTSTSTTTTVPTCGNGVVDGGEQCDPALPPSCPGSPGGAFLPCNPDCTCPAFCGNGIVDPGEQCDPSGSACGSPAGAFMCDAQCACAPAPTTTTTQPTVTTTTSSATSSTQSSTTTSVTTSTATSTTTTVPCVPTGPEAGTCSDMIDNDCDGKIDCADPDCQPTRCVGGTQNGQDCSTDAGIQACTLGGGVCQCPRIQKDPTTITFRKPGATLDRLRSHGRVTILGPLDILDSEVGWLVSNDRGRIFGVVLPPGILTANTNRTLFKYKNVSAKSQGGVYRALIRIKLGTSYAYTVEAYGDMSAATDPNMAIQLYMGHLATSAIHSEVWTRMNNGWKANGFE